jgi:hypothetical protein
LAPQSVIVGVHDPVESQCRIVSMLVAVSHSETQALLQQTLFAQNPCTQASGCAPLQGWPRLSLQVLLEAQV